MVRALPRGLRCSDEEQHFIVILVVVAARFRAPWVWPLCRRGYVGQGASGDWIRTMATSEALGLLDRLYDSFGTGDASSWEGSIAADAVLIGTDPNEFWSDPESAKIALRSQLDEMKDAGISLKQGERLVRELGNDVVLVVDQPTITLPNGGRQEVRLTALFAGSGTSLQMKHFHLSVPARNEDVLDTQLTT